MTLQDIHALIKRMVPEAGIVSVSHSYINNICQESWSAMVYWKTDSPDDSLDTAMFHVTSSGGNYENLIEAIASQYSRLDTAKIKAEAIEKLKRQLAELEA